MSTPKPFNALCIGVTSLVVFGVPSLGIMTNYSLVKDELATKGDNFPSFEYMNASNRIGYVTGSTLFETLKTTSGAKVSGEYDVVRTMTPAGVEFAVNPSYKVTVTPRKGVYKSERQAIYTANSVEICVEETGSRFLGVVSHSVTSCYKRDHGNVRTNWDSKLFGITVSAKGPDKYVKYDFDSFEKGIQKGYYVYALHNLKENNLRNLVGPVVSKKLGGKNSLADILFANTPLWTGETNITVFKATEASRQNSVVRVQYGDRDEDKSTFVFEIRELEDYGALPFSFKAERYGFKVEAEGYYSFNDVEDAKMILQEWSVAVPGTLPSVRETQDRDYTVVVKKTPDTTKDAPCDLSVSTGEDTYITECTSNPLPVEKLNELFEGERARILSLIKHSKPGDGKTVVLPLAVLDDAPACERYGVQIHPDFFRVVVRSPQDSLSLR